MLTNNQSFMFASIAREYPALREWAAGELSKQIKTLVHVIDGEQLRRAQGHAQCLQTLIDHLDASSKSPRNAGSST